MYEDILTLLSYYEIADMRNIKNNLRDIFKCKKLNKGSFAIISITLHTEQSYLNPSHPHNIPFLTLLKICNYLDVTIEEVLKPNNRKIDENKSYHGALIWNKEKKKEFKNYLQINGIEETAKFYNLSAESVIRYEKKFKSKIRKEE